MDDPPTPRELKGRTHSYRNHDPREYEAAYRKAIREQDYDGQADIRIAVA